MPRCELPECGNEFASNKRGSPKRYCCPRCRLTAKARRYLATPGGKATRAGIARRYNATSNGRAKNREGERRRYATPKGKARQAAAFRRWYADPRSARQVYDNNRSRKDFFQHIKFLANLEVVMAGVNGGSGPRKRLTLAAVKKEVSGMTMPEKVAAFEEGMRLHHDNLLRLGVLIVSIEADGGVVQCERMFLQLLREIGSGDLLPDVVVKFATRPMAMNYVRNMPVAGQKAALAKTVSEVEEEIRRLPQGRGHFETPGGVGGPTYFPSLANLGKSLSPAEAADLCSQIIDNHPAPQSVIAILAAKFAGRDNRGDKKAS